MEKPIELKDLKPFLPFLNHLTKEQTTLLLQNVVKKHYKKGENVYNGTTQCLGLLLIVSGDLRTYLLSEQGRDITLYRLLSGDVCILTASCILRNITFDVHVDASEDTTVYLINANTFSTIMKHNIYVENFSYKSTIDRFSDVMWTMEQILFMSFDKRLAIFLVDECSKKKTTSLTLTHSAIATYMGSAREVVSRMLKYFESEGIVTLSRGGIEIINMKKLKELL